VKRTARRCPPDCQYARLRVVLRVRECLIGWAFSCRREKEGGEVSQTLLMLDPRTPWGLPEAFCSRLVLKPRRPGMPAGAVCDHVGPAAAQSPGDRALCSRRALLMLAGGVRSRAAGHLRAKVCSYQCPGGTSRSPRRGDVRRGPVSFAAGSRGPAGPRRRVSPIPEGDGGGGHLQVGSGRRPAWVGEGEDPDETAWS